MSKKKLLSPKNDYVFKRLFSYQGSENITKNLVNSIISDKVKKLTLDHSTILEKDLMDDKVGILDIKAKLNNNINCNIEIQLVDQKNIEKRLMYYWSKMYTQEIKEGEPYSELEKTIVILFADFKLEKLKKIPKYLTKWQIREEEYVQIVLTNVLEIYILELAKFNEVKVKEKTELSSWLKFIENPEDVNMSEVNKEIKEANEILENISSDEHERELAELRMKYIRDQKAIEEGGYDKGYKAGIMKGISQGIEQNKIEIAKRLLSQNIDNEIISNVTELSIEEIEKISITTK